MVRFSSIFVWLIKNFILSISCFLQYFYLLNFICMDCVDFLLSFIYLFVLCFNSLKEFLGVMPAWEFWEAIKWMEVKVGKHWKPYGIGDTRAVGCLLRRAVVRGWDQPSRQKCEADREVPLDIGHRVIGFGVCPSWFRSYFVPVFCHNDPFPPFFWNKNVFSLPLNGGSL